jgi:hypothetical protein
VHECKRQHLRGLLRTIPVRIRVHGPTSKPARVQEPLPALTCLEHGMQPATEKHVDTLPQDPDFLRGYRLALVHIHLGRFNGGWAKWIKPLLKEIDRRLE